MFQIKSVKKDHMKEANQELEEKEPNLQSLQILLLWRPSHPMTSVTRSQLEGRSSHIIDERNALFKRITTVTSSWRPSHA